MVGLHCRRPWYPALTRPPGVDTPGCMMSPLSGLGNGWFALSAVSAPGVDTTTRRSHAGLYDVAPFGARGALTILLEFWQEDVDSQYIGGQFGLDSLAYSLQARRLSDAAVGFQQVFSALLCHFIQVGRDHVVRLDYLAHKVDGLL